MGLSGLIESIDTAVASVGSNSVGDNERRELLQACERLRTAYEKPLDIVTRLYYSGPQAIMLRLGVDLKLFDAMAKLSSQSTNGDVNIQQLVAEAGAEPLLLARIMRFLAAMGIVREVSKDTFSSTSLTAAFVSSSPLAAVVIHGTYFLTVLSKLPEYFAQRGWRSPDDADDGPFQFATETKSHYFDFLSSEPYYQQAFNTTMTVPFRRNGHSWFTFFPVEKKLRVEGPTAPLLIDIGGGQGEDILAFRDRYPNLPGKLILQDLPVVVEGARDAVCLGVEVQGYNFFDEQPVKGAKAYYSRTVLHDWPDKQALRILAQVGKAMSPESLLLINEVLVPETNRSLSSVVADLTMMTSFAALERTEAQFKTLLDNSRFELVNIWMCEGMEGTSAALLQQAVLLEARLKRY